MVVDGKAVRPFPAACLGRTMRYSSRGSPLSHLIAMVDFCSMPASSRFFDHGPVLLISMGVGAWFFKLSDEAGSGAKFDARKKFPTHEGSHHEVRLVQKMPIAGE